MFLLLCYCLFMSTFFFLARTSKKVQSIYRAIPIGSPNSPKVLLQRINDKVIESSKNGSVRIFVADSKIGKVEDAKSIVLNKLKNEKQQMYEKTPEKKPIIHSLIQNNLSPENVYFNNSEGMNDNDSNVESEIDKTPDTKLKLNTKKNATFISSLNKTRKQLFTCGTRSSPRKSAALKNFDVRSSPQKKAKMLPEIDDINRLSSHEMASGSYDEDDFAVKFSNQLKIEKDMCNDLEKQPVIHSVGPKNAVGEDAEFEIDGHKNDVKEMVSKTVKCKKTVASKKNASSSVKKVHKNEITASPKHSPYKNAIVESSDIYSTPTKKAKFADVVNDFQLTRSGRRVKAVNYSEQYVFYIYFCLALNLNVLY